jgi:predicted GNAT family N-acyltransferase
MNELHVQVVSYDQELTNIEAIRSSVFQDEQGVDPQLEFDGLDQTAVHFLAYWRGQAVGTARIRSLNEHAAKIERLAVLKSARHQGIGWQLMEKALEFAVEQQFDEVVVNSQEYVKDLYEKLGFKQVGEPFQEAGISHVKMVKKLV